MKMPKTINGYISLMKKIEKELSPQNLKGFENITKEKKELLTNLDAEISNHINEL